MVSDLDELIIKVTKYTMASVNPERFAHSVRTAETARILCCIYNENEKMGYLAGVAHDMCKDMSGSVQVYLAKQDGYILSDIEKKKNSLLHGRAASVLLRRDFGIDNCDLLESVCCHTFGKKGLSNLGKIIYSADKIEPGRPHMTKEYFDVLTGKSLNALVFHILEENIAFLRKQKKEVALSTLEFYESLKGEYSAESTAE